MIKTGIFVLFATQAFDVKNKENNVRGRRPRYASERQNRDNIKIMNNSFTVMTTFTFRM